MVDRGAGVVCSIPQLVLALRHMGTVPTCRMRSTSSMVTSGSVVGTRTARGILAAAGRVLVLGCGLGLVGYSVNQALRRRLWKCAGRPHAV